MKNTKWTTDDSHPSCCGSFHGVSCTIANSTTHLPSPIVTVNGAKSSGTAPHRTTSVFKRIPGERLNHWSADVRTTPFVHCSIPECREKNIGYEGSSYHRSSAQGKCRTARGLSTETAKGPSNNRKLQAKCGRKCRLGALTGHVVRTLADLCIFPPFGFLNGISLSPKRKFNFGVIRTSCLILIILHFCLLTSVASARHRSRDLARNQTHAADTDEMVEALMRQGPSPPTVPKKSPMLRKLGRMGRTGRRRQRDSAQEMGKILSQIKTELSNATCQPRDTIVDSFTLLNIDRGYIRLVPECIAVPRCRNGGCCLEHEECVTDQTVNKTVYFLTFNDSVLNKTIQVDTRCRCQEKQPYCGLTSADCSWPKVLNVDSCSCQCPRKCPEPFLLNERCECDCLMSDKPCKNFFRGKKGAKLSPSDCSCVRSHECIEPPCANGVFHMNSCKCRNNSNSKR